MVMEVKYKEKNEGDCKTERRSNISAIPRKKTVFKLAGWCLLSYIQTVIGVINSSDII
jgi:hypothetical protein